MNPALSVVVSERPVVMSYQQADIATFLDNRAHFGKLLADEHFIGLLSLAAKRVPVDPLFPRTCHLFLEPKAREVYIFQVVLTSAEYQICDYFKGDPPSELLDGELLPFINHRIEEVVSSFQNEVRNASARAQYVKTFGDGVVQAAGLGREWSGSDKGKCWAVYAHFFR